MACKYTFDAIEKESIFCARNVYSVLNQSRTDKSLETFGIMFVCED